MKVLLIEPNYFNKYPPLGLMKLSTYHKQRGDEVIFFKGNIKEFITRTLASGVIDLWLSTAPEYPRHLIPVEEIRAFIARGLKTAFSAVEAQASPEVISRLLEIRKSYLSKAYLDDPSWKWDRVYVTTLFTFYWNTIIKTIEEAKPLVKSMDNFYVGGVTATILGEELIRQTNLSPSNLLTGLLDTPGRIDPGDPTIIDELPLDYSILDEIDHQYKEHGNYYTYMTRGCVRRCEFCIVHVIEPKYRKYIPLAPKIEHTKATYGEQKHLLLLDNNVMASGSYKQVIEEILSLGFHKGATFERPDYLTIAINQLREGKTDRGALIRASKFLALYAEKLPNSPHKEQLMERFTDKGVFLDTHYLLPLPENLIDAYEQIKDHHLSTLRKSKSYRYVDFNQGVDARLITDEKMKLLSKIAIRPLRIAFDSWAMEETYTKAVKTAARHGINYLSNYLLYNFKDEPVELYYRLRHNVRLGVELGVQIFSFPMKYHPVKDVEYFSNRTYMGYHWNRKYIRAIQLVLNSTKGKVGSSPSFFEHAYGKDEDEFHKILLMPDEYIFYRDKNTLNGNIDQWWQDYTSLTPEEKELANTIIHTNSFSPGQWSNLPPTVQTLLAHYAKS